jgi:aspartyl-tRNA(Asn)/glutamyl-tRNA(Gln) amidotransferase subunit C
MKITASDVRHLAVLSKISLADDEIEPMAKDLENIVKYIDMLNELNTDGVEPTYQVTGLKNVMRNDNVEPQIAREKLLALAPEQKNNQVKVPKVL